MFIYVFSKDAKNELIAKGLAMMKSDDANERYIFAATSDKLFFADFKHNYAVSDILTF